MTRPGLAALAFAAVLAPAVAADKPTRAEIGKRAKAATAFADVPGHGSGTAFCIHPAGLFVTNHHVVRGLAPDAAVTLVLNPALPTQRVLKATVARVDAAADLALLRADGAADLPALPLGTAAGVAELADVVAAGFPLGRAVSPEKDKYPSVSVNAGTVSALRHKGPDLEFLQVDVSLNYGNSGGPVLDADAKVIGVVVSGVPGARGINQAIPVDRLARFVRTPDLRFTPPTVDAAALASPVEFKATLAAVLPGEPAPTAVRLVLKVTRGAAREFPMTEMGGVWSVTATPVAAGTTGRVDVTAAVVAFAGRKEVARVDAVVPVREPAAPSVVAVRPSTPPTPPAVPVKPPALAEDETTKRLPEVYADVAQAGGGRYLVFHLPKLRKLAVFDVSAARITGYIPVAEEGAAFGAGMDAAVVGLPKAGTLERWNLTTFQKEKAAPFPFEEAIQTVALGHASAGPVAVNGYFFDLATLRQLAVADEDGKGRVWEPNERYVPSADGTTFGGWRTHGSPDYTYVVTVGGNTIRRTEEVGLRHAVPGPDGRDIFCGKGVAGRTLKRGSPADAGLGYCLPAARGLYFLSLTSAEERTGRGGTFTAHLRGLDRPLARRVGGDHGLTFNGWDREKTGPWNRVFFVPDAKVIAVLPTSNDRVVLHKFDPDAALEASGEDYLLVTSRPPAGAVRPGTTFTYPLAVKAKGGGATVSLDAGPPGMTASPAGVVTWAVPADAPVGLHDVILSVRKGAGGAEAFHTFTVAVDR